MATQLTGKTSIFPYGVDQYESQNNYENSNLGEQGDVIRATFRNHLADTVLNMEAELLNCAKSSSGDMFVSCVTAKVTNWLPDATYTVTIPEDVMDMICDNGTGTPSLLQSATFPVAVLASARPQDKLSMWDQLDFRGAMHVCTWVNGNSVTFKILDPAGYLKNHSSYSGDPNYGDFILSVILFRQK